MTRLVFATIAAYLLFGVADAATIQPRAALLRTLAEAKGKYFGTSTLASELRSDSTLQNVDGSFDMITPGNELKWDATEPSRGSFQFTDADYVVAYAQSKGARIRGHTLVWYSQLPSWVSAITDKTTLTSVLTTHINTVVGRYKGKFYAWDVVNEAFNEDGTLRASVWPNVLGSGYIATAFQLAHAADSTAKLYINDYNTESQNAKSNALLSTVKSLLAAGVPIHGVGFQAHMIEGQIPSGVAANLARFTALGVEIAITELDVRIKLPTTPANLAQQGTDYVTMVNACFTNSGCKGVTVWDTTDKYSWVPSVFSGYGAALLWDEYYNQKPAYNAVVAAIS